MQGLLALPAAVKLSGDTDWHMSMPIAVAVPRRPAVATSTSILICAASASTLPEPLGKGIADERALQVALEIDDEQLLTRTSYGDVRALIRMRQANGAWALDRGGVRADAVAPALPGHRGLRIEGNVQRFVLDDWLALRGASAAPGAAKQR